MQKKNNKVLIVASFEDASILRKFTILFLGASIIPLTLLYYIYSQDERAHSDVSTAGYSVAILLTAIGVLAGYLSMRSLLTKVIDITKANRKAIEGFLSPETMKELDGQNEIVVLSRSFSAVTQRLEENIRSLEATKKTLQSVMAKVGHGISNMENIDTFLQLIVETMTNALSGKAGALMTFNELKNELVVRTVYGLEFDPAQPLHLKVAPSSPLAGIIESKRPHTLSDGLGEKTSSLEFNSLFDRYLICVPLVYQDRVSGVMILSQATQDKASSDESTGLLFNLASQTAVALENSSLNKDIEKTYFETISALALAVDAKDKYSRGHLDRVADYAAMTGMRLGLQEKDLNILRDAARLHDLGKIGIPDEILRKEGPLTDEEWVIMRRHPEIGESIIKPVRSLQPLCDPIRHHHERLDGTGYPDGLKEHQISRLVRILTIADIYDALTTERSYRPKKSREEAAALLRSMKTHLDQNVVEIFLTGLTETAGDGKIKR